MNKTRLLKLADFLDTLPRQKFDFSNIAVEGGKPMREALEAGPTRCGTVACALGWTPMVFPRLVKWMPVRRWGATDPPAYAVCRRDTAAEPAPLGDEWETTRATAEVLFGLGDADVLLLFAPGKRVLGYSGLSERTTPKTVARHIRKFIAQKAKHA